MKLLHTVKNVSPNVIEPGLHGAWYAQAIRAAIQEAGRTVPQEIARKQLYFRVSLLGGCNLACPFCHNEGAPKKGLMDVSFAVMAMQAAADIGFTRVHFTGGEPLLHPEVDQFVSRARKLFNHVGVTTNGTLLSQKISALLDAGVTRIHVSLQVASLQQAGGLDRWGIPDWLEQVFLSVNNRQIALRLNMPVPDQYLRQAGDFLRLLAPFGCDLQVFSILPIANGNESEEAAAVRSLRQLVDRENEARQQYGTRGRIFLRDYLPPSGIRCQTCVQRHRCMEKSHSLRLGADHILRPCLATREWDIPLSPRGPIEPMTRATLLALDY